MLRKIVGWAVAAAPIIALLIVMGIKIEWYGPLIVLGFVGVILAFVYVGLRIAGV